MALKGSVHGGQQPITGSHVYLMAANTTGYGNASVSLLNAVSTGHSDTVGAYVLSDPQGNFSISGDYSCTPNTQVYVYALGGDPGGGTNSAAGLMAALGNCPVSGTFVGAISFIDVNEATTVAAAYAIAGFATDATHVSSSGTPLALTGIANAFANAANLATIATGSALTTTPGGNGTAPQSEIYSLANILAACINTNDSVTISAGCSTLFANATADGTPTGTQPTDTATAAINIAHNPGANVTALYNLSTAQAPFAPVLASAPNDFTVGIQFTGGGLDDPQSIAIDGSGDVWTANNGNSSVTELSSNGSPISPAGGLTASGYSSFFGIAVDLTGNAWVPAESNNSLLEFSGLTGTATVFTGGGLNFPYAVAVDGSGNKWVTNVGNSSLSEFGVAGTVISTSAYTGGNLGNPKSIAIDHNGYAWVSNNGNSTVTEVSASGGVATFKSGSNGYSGGGLNTPYSIAIDASGNAWIANLGSLGNGDITELEGASAATPGTPISTSSGYTGGGIVNPDGIALDGAGNAWVADQVGTGIVAKFSSSGSAISPSTGYVVPGVTSTISVAVDPSGNLWVADGSATQLTELVGAATPVVTPLSIAARNNTLATRP